MFSFSRQELERVRNQVQHCLQILDRCLLASRQIHDECRAARGGLGAGERSERMRAGLREQDLILELVHVVRGRQRRASDDARVADLVRGQRLLPQRLTADGSDREDEIGEQRVRGAQIHLVQDRRVDVVVDERRRAEGAVVRQAERVVGLRLDHDGGAWREHEVVQVVEPIDTRPDDEAERPLACEDPAPARFDVKREVTRALEALRPRDRDLLWLAYTMGLSHAEMARTLARIWNEFLPAELTRREEAREWYNADSP